ncbi:MAG: trigger factor, partial [Thiothrix sp.]|nr:trigger factor [Thiothrix sp.]
ERIDQEVEKRLKSLVKRVRLDGFRPGKVPYSVVKQRYSASVHQDVVGEVLEQSFRDASSQEQLRVAGLPNIDLVSSLKLGQPLEYVATFQVYPEFEVADVSGLTLTRIVADVEEKDIDKMLDVIRNQQREWNEAARAAREGDRVLVDFNGSLDGEAFEGGSADDYLVEIGSGRMLPDFEAALVGMSAGDETVADVAFPEDYQAENLKGKTAQFRLKAKRVDEARMPELDEAFIRQFGVEDGSLDSFRAEVRKNMGRELGNALRTRLKQQVMDGLARLHDIEVPEALVRDEAAQVRDEFLRNSGLDPDDAKSGSISADLFKPQAERRVKLGLIVGEIIRKNDIQLDQARVDTMLESLAASYEEPEALMTYYRQTPQAMQSVQAAVMEDMIVDWVVAQAEVQEEKRDFDAVMN